MSWGGVNGLAKGGKGWLEVGQPEHAEETPPTLNHPPLSIQMSVLWHESLSMPPAYIIHSLSIMAAGTS